MFPDGTPLSLFFASSLLWTAATTFGKRKLSIKGTTSVCSNFACKHLWLFKQTFASRFAQPKFLDSALERSSQFLRIAVLHSFCCWLHCNNSKRKRIQGLRTKTASTKTLRFSAAARLRQLWPDRVISTFLWRHSQVNSKSSLRRIRSNLSSEFLLY